MRPVNRLAAPIRGFAQRFAYLGLVLAAFGLMMLGKADALLVERLRANVTDAVAPILDALSRPVATAADWVLRAESMIALYEENKRLREDNATLLQWQAAARRLETENAQLRSLLQFAPERPGTFISGRVIADHGGAYAQSFLVNAGTNSGVRPGQAVVTEAGLVGRTDVVGGRSARVLLITDLNSRIPVVVEHSRVRAILAGDNTNRPRLIHLPQGALVSPGDRIVTSGHGGAFPPGVPVGMVTAVSDSGIVVQPYVNYDRLEYVRIIDLGLTGILQLPQKFMPEGPRTSP